MSSKKGGYVLGTGQYVEDSNNLSSPKVPMVPNRPARIPVGSPPPRYSKVNMEMTGPAPSAPVEGILSPTSSKLSASAYPKAPEGFQSPRYPMEEGYAAASPSVYDQNSAQNRGQQYQFQRYVICFFPC